MTGNIKPVRRISPFVMIVILLAFILSLSALYIAVDSIINQSESLDGYSFLAIGFGGIALSIYMIFQTRVKPKHSNLELPRVLTTEECPKCDFKNIREFKRGDYIFKKTGSCEKCKETMTITAIYREPKKTDKK
ncbi:hypothetical protein KJN74_01890 [Candidatus Bathyarchaeota archaeon]|nr:hypothetical protein [Candidatus Bathyarchaeota archaeon]